MEPLGSTLTCFSTVKRTCETTFSCFAYVTSENDQPEYGCVLSKVNHLFMCNAHPTNTFVARCCNEDMCNRGLNLTMPEGSSDEIRKSMFLQYSFPESFNFKYCRKLTAVVDNCLLLLSMIALTFSQHCKHMLIGFCITFVLNALLFAF